MSIVLVVYTLLLFVYGSRIAASGPMNAWRRRDAREKRNIGRCSLRRCAREAVDFTSRRREESLDLLRQHDDIADACCALCGPSVVFRREQHESHNINSTEHVDDDDIGLRHRLVVPRPPAISSFSPSPNCSDQRTLRPNHARLSVDLDGLGAHHAHLLAFCGPEIVLGQSCPSYSWDGVVITVRDQYGLERRCRGWIRRE